MKTSKLSLLVVLLHAAAVGCGDDSGTGANGGQSQGGEANGGSAQGGQAQGGQAQGGQAQGGGGSGGTAQGGSGQGGSGGGAQAQAECASAADCTIVNDCCTCEAIPTGEPPPDCNIPECFVLTCATKAHDGATSDCQVGRCVAAFTCDHTLVTCDQAEPDCPAGQTPIVNDQGCWGACVPATECASVATCDQCGPGDACVEVGGPNAATHCVAIPDECNGTATCACMGQSVCGNVTCADTNSSLVCQVP